MTIETTLLNYSGVTGARLGTNHLSAAAATARAAYKDASAAYKAADTAVDAAYETSIAAADAASYIKTKAGFFQPFKATSDAFFSVTSIISAPVFLSVLSAKELLTFIVSGLRSLVNLAMLDTVSAKIYFDQSKYFLLKSFEFLLAAAVSPFVNSVDFFGSAVTSLMSELPAEDKEAPEFKP